MPDLLFPKLSEAMEEGTLLTWLAHDGQVVTTGDNIAEIETDKVTVVHTSDADGVLHILVPEGTRCTVGTVIARVEPQSVPSEVAVESNATASPAATSAQPSKPRPDRAVPLEAEIANGVAASENLSVVATPLARRAALVHNVRLDAVRATGPGGRVTQSDVLRAVGALHGVPGKRASAGTSSHALRAAVPAAPASGERGEVSVVGLTQLHRVIAERMAQANRTVPAFQVQVEAAVDAALALRERLKERPGADPAPSLNDLVIKACALALREVPLANASFTDAGFEYHSRINIGFAVAFEDALVVPTVFDADTRTLGAIAAETRRLAGLVRSGNITPADVSGGTFTVSNLGMYGMSAITPVVNPGQAAIVGVGATREVLARTGGVIVERTVMTLTLSCDHRILYGAEAARLLSTIRALLEDPLRLGGE